MKRPILLAFAVSFSAMMLAANINGSTTSLAATCTGAKKCTACKNCKYCKHCKKDGGTCGVCK